MQFFRFDPDVYSTFSRERAEELRSAGARQMGTLMVEVETLADVLRQHAGGRVVDFLSVDTEGLDLSVLRGNDWQQFRPRVICVEAPECEEDGTRSAATSAFLESVGYRRHAVTEQYGVPLNEIYVDGSLSFAAEPPQIPGTITRSICESQQKVPEVAKVGFEVSGLCRVQFLEHRSGESEHRILRPVARLFQYFEGKTAVEMRGWPATRWTSACQ